MTGGEVRGATAVVVLALRDPALWGAVSAAACGYSDIQAWAIVPLMLALAGLIWLYGSPLVWRYLMGGAGLGRGDYAGIALLASFSIVVIAYVAGDLLHHLSIDGRA